MVLMMGRRRQGGERKKKKKDSVVPLTPTNFRHLALEEKPRRSFARFPPLEELGEEGIGLLDSNTMG